MNKLFSSAWYIGTVDAGIIAGPFRTKWLASIHRGDAERPLKKQSSGEYSDGLCTVARGGEMEAAGFTHTDSRQK